MVSPKNKGGKMQTIEKNRLDPKLFSELKFQNIEEAGLEMLYLTVHSKLAEYQAEERHFENKYRMSFKKFQDNILKKINDEDFEEEDDFMAWQFAHENARYWKRKASEVERCL
jgi:hypothetical protein